MSRGDGGGAGTATGRLYALHHLFAETLALARRLDEVTGEVHQFDSLSGTQRSLLRQLDEAGPSAVPRLAAARGVSRQHVQVVVNELAEMGLVQLRDNPAHKRSRLACLSPAGAERVRAIIRREEDLLAAAGPTQPESALRAAAETLRSVRGLFEGARWERARRALE